jgi:hypothetical protein
MTAVGLFWPLIVVCLALVSATATGLALAGRWHPVLGTVGAALQTGAGMAGMAAGHLARDWPFLWTGAGLFVFGLLNLWRTDQYARSRRDGKP